MHGFVQNVLVCGMRAHYYYRVKCELDATDAISHCICNLVTAFSLSRTKGCMHIDSFLRIEDYRILACFWWLFRLFSFLLYIFFCILLFSSSFSPPPSLLFHSRSITRIPKINEQFQHTFSLSFSFFLTRPPFFVSLMFFHSQRFSLSLLYYKQHFHSIEHIRRTIAKSIKTTSKNFTILFPLRSTKKSN